MRSSVQLAVASADHISQPATHPLLVSQVSLTELTLQVLLLGKDREHLQGPRAYGSEQQDPHVTESDSYADACDHHLQVHRIARETVWTALDDFRGRLPWILALPGPAHDENRPPAQQQHRASEDDAADPVSDELGNCEADVDRPDVLQTDAREDRDEWDRRRKTRTAAASRAGRLSTPVAIST